MDRLEAFRLALAEIGDVSAAELATHIQKKYGVIIEPRFVPVYKAAIRDMERTSKLRQNATPVPPKDSSEAA